MNKSAVIVVVVLVVVVALGAWYWLSMGGQYSSPAPQAQTQPASESAPAITQSATPTLAVGTSGTLGKYLVAKNGMTLYKYAKDTAGVSNCSGTCAVNWPPYPVPADEALTADAGVTGEMGFVSRADGIIQLTYKGTPLYFWKNDAKPGDTTGQNVGGVWTVVQP